MINSYIFLEKWGACLSTEEWYKKHILYQKNAYVALLAS